MMWCNIWMDVNHVSIISALNYLFLFQLKNNFSKNYKLILHKNEHHCSSLPLQKITNTKTKFQFISYPTKQKHTKRTNALSHKKIIIKKHPSHKGNYPFIKKTIFSSIHFHSTINSVLFFFSLLNHTQKNPSSFFFSQNNIQTKKNPSHTKKQTISIYPFPPPTHPKYLTKSFNKNKHLSLTTQ